MIPGGRETKGEGEGREGVYSDAANGVSYGVSDAAEDAA
jgi:hypothetical protein